jgi:hypothetical protein
MSTFAVSPIGTDRFAIWVVTKGGQPENGPYGGADHKGLTEPEARAFLKKYGWSEIETQARIDAANDARKP